MRKTAQALAFALGFLPALAAAQAPQFPQNLPANSVVGRLGVGPGPSQAIPFANLVLPVIGNAFVQFAGPTAPIKTYTLPNFSDTIVTLTAPQTLTNKTLTSPVFVTPALGDATGSSINISGAAQSSILRLGVSGGAPVSTGTTDPNGVVNLGNNNVAFRFGIYTVGDMWLQPSSTANFATNFSTVLNPNGGNVGIGVAGPTSQLHVKGNIAQNGATSGTSILVPPATGGGNIQLFAGSDTAVGRNTTDTLTNKSIVATQLTGTLQAAQEPAHTGDCTNSAGSLALTCLKTNGTSFTAGATAAAGQLPGEPSTGSASAGNVGEYPAPATSASTGITTGTQTNITSISLTAGDWDVWGEIIYTPAASTNVVEMWASLSLTSATLDQTLFNYSRLVNASAGIVPGAVNIPTWIGPRRVSISATTTVFLVGFTNFTVSTMTTVGGIRARRVR